MDLSTPVKYVKGVGPARAQALESKGILTVEDLLSYAPFRYEDRSNTKPVGDLAPGEMATVVATVRSARLSGFSRRDLGLFEATFTDASGGVLVAKWFHAGYLADVLAPGQKVALYGKVEFDNFTGELSMLHPEFEILPEEDEDPEASLHVGRIVPVYEAAGKISTRVFRRIMHQALEALAPLPDPLPPSVRERLELPDRWQATRELHFPPAEADLR
ncbi:MAG: ATP-dependent DNA helicase RecG, partial [Bryobacteraceae bacterium]|nr:ATP-dependent DNA helicase RecG [Bryobacteraceae bacterium]